MSFAKVYSAQINNLNGYTVDVEIDLSKGLHSFSIVGLPDKSVDESKDRISSAIKNSGFKSPKRSNQKIVVSLAPSEIKKEGAGLDLAIALGFLKASKEIIFDENKKMFLGELGLDGSIRKVKGILSLVKSAKQNDFEEVFIPEENAKEGALIKGIKIFPVKNLKEVIEHLDKEKDFNIEEFPETKIIYEDKKENDFSEIKGQENVKRALEIAAAGRHNIAMYGPPGTGKTMLAKAFCSILPELSYEKILETTAIASVSGILQGDIITRPPFRSPHHTSSYTAIVGGGAIPKPGEITLSHNGVLFLDEFPEFERKIIDSLRQPLEDKEVTVSRVKGTAKFPADFVLLVALNPCPCGNYGSDKTCSCSTQSILNYRKKISGPIMDRIDMWIEVPNIDYEKLSDRTEGEGSKIIKERVLEATKKQEARLGEGRNNSSLKAKELENLNIEKSIRNTLNEYATKLKISPRSYHKIIKLSRTIADLDNKDEIEMNHLLEALQYRPKEL